MANINDLLKEMAKAAQSGDLDAVTKLSKAIQEERKAEEERKFQASKKERDTWTAMVQDTLGEIKVSELVDNIDLIVHVKNIGKDKQMISAAIDASKLATVVTKQLAELLTQTPEMVTQFTYNKDGMVLGRATGGTTKAPASNGVKGWTKDGQDYTLGQAFELAATPKEVAEEAAATDGNTKYSIKTRVVKAAGFSKG